MSHLEAWYKKGSSESLYELKPPTCEKYEPNFLKIFSFIQDGNMDDQKNIFTPQGDIVASVWDNETIFGFRKWINDVPSNAASLPMLVKNPYKIPEQEGLIGIRNGLVCPG